MPEAIADLAKEHGLEEVDYGSLASDLGLQEVEPDTAVGSFLRGAKSKLASGVGGLLGAIGAGAAAGPESGFLASVPAGIIGAGAGSALGEKFYRSIMGDEGIAREQAQLEANRLAGHGFAGGAGEMLPALLPAASGGGSAVKSLSKLAGASGREIGAVEQTLGKAFTKGGEDAIRATAAGVKTAAPVGERVAQALMGGAQMGEAGEAARQVDEGKLDLGKLAAAPVEDAIKFGPVGLIPHAEGILKSIAKGIPDAAVMTLSSDLYDHMVHGKPLSLEGYTTETGEAIPSFLLLNAITGLLHGKPVKMPEGDKKLQSTEAGVPRLGYNDVIEAPWTVEGPDKGGPLLGLPAPKGEGPIIDIEGVPAGPTDNLSFKPPSNPQSLKDAMMEDDAANLRGGVNNPVDILTPEQEAFLQSPEGKDALARQLAVEQAGNGTDASGNPVDARLRALAAGEGLVEEPSILPNAEASAQAMDDLLSSEEYLRQSPEGKQALVDDLRSREATTSVDSGESPVKPSMEPVGASLGEVARPSAVPTLGASKDRSQSVTSTKERPLAEVSPKTPEEHASAIAEAQHNLDRARELYSGNPELSRFIPRLEKSLQEAKDAAAKATIPVTLPDGTKAKAPAVVSGELNRDAQRTSAVAPKVIEDHKKAVELEAKAAAQAEKQKAEKAKLQSTEANVEPKSEEVPPAKKEPKPKSNVKAPAKAESKPAKPSPEPAVQEKPKAVTGDGDKPTRGQQDSPPAKAPIDSFKEGLNPKTFPTEESKDNAWAWLNGDTSKADSLSDIQKRQADRVAREKKIKLQSPEERSKDAKALREERSEKKTQAKEEKRVAKEKAKIEESKALNEMGEGDLKKWADDVVKEGNVNSGLNPKLLAAHAIRAADWIKTNGEKFVEWSKSMLKEFGYSIQRHLNSIWKSAKEVVKGGIDYIKKLVPQSDAAKNTRMGMAQGTEEVKVGSMGAIGHTAKVKKALDEVKSDTVKSVTNLGKAIKENFQAAKRYLDTAEARHGISATYDAIETKTSYAASKAKSVVKVAALDAGLEHSDAVMKAATLVRQVRGDTGGKNGMIQRLEKIIANGKGDKIGKDADEVLKLLKTKWDSLTQVANAARQGTDDAYQAFKKAGGDLEYFEGYVKGDYIDPTDGSVVFDEKPPGAPGSSFKQKKKFYDYTEAILAGREPTDLRLDNLTQSGVGSTMRSTEKKLWEKSLESTNMPDGNPVLKPIVDGKVPDGYRDVRIIQGSPSAIHEEAAPLIRALTEVSQVPKAISKFAAFIKHNTLVYDLFHASRFSQLQAAFEKKFPSYKKGLAIMEYPDEILDSAVKHDLISKEEADWARTNRPKVEKLIAHGLNAGRISDALYADAIPLAPGSKQVNQFIFQKLSRGVIVQSAVHALEKNAKAHPEWTPEQLHSYTSKEVNTYYRNLGSQGIFKSKTFQDLARIIAFAPQWVEGMVRSEARGYGQLAKAPFTGKLGNVGAAMATGAVAYFAAAQLVNMLTRGHPTWENDEPGHKLDAWIPDSIQGSEGYFISPLSVFAETTHDALKYSGGRNEGADVAAQIISNKLHPVARSIKTFLGGEDFAGRPLHGMDRVTTSLTDLAPIPIFAKVGGQSGGVERQALSLAGIKAESAKSHSADVYKLAEEYKAKHNLKQFHASEPSEYKPLNTALAEGDMAAAREEYQKLKASKSPKDIDEYFKSLPSRPFTGSKDSDLKFVKSLSPGEKVIYARARAEQRRMAERYRAIRMATSLSVN